MQIANLFKLLIDPENMLSVANVSKAGGPCGTVTGHFCVDTSSLERY